MHGLRAATSSSKCRRCAGGARWCCGPRAQIPPGALPPSAYGTTSDSVAPAPPKSPCAPPPHQSPRPPLPALPALMPKGYTPNTPGGLPPPLPPPPPCPPPPPPRPPGPPPPPPTPPPPPPAHLLGPATSSIALRRLQRPLSPPPQPNTYTVPNVRTSSVRASRPPPSPSSPPPPHCPAPPPAAPTAPRPPPSPSHTHARIPSSPARRRPHHLLNRTLRLLLPLRPNHPCPRAP